MTKGLFRKYFLYKLSKSKRSIIFFAILNLLGVLLASILMNITYASMLNESIRVHSEPHLGVVILQPYDFTSIALFLITVTMLINIVMITATTIKSMKLYYNRASVDTLGSLPVSYRERFFGDLLSGICSNFISFVPFFLIALILFGNMRNPKYVALEGYFVSNYLNMPRIFTGLLTMMLLVYLGVYAVTTFVCTCCGKKGSAVLYSLIAMAVLPGIYLVYGNNMLSQVLGVDAFYELMKNVGMLPPLGPVVSLLMSNTYRGYSYIDPKWCMLNENPFYLVIFLIITAAFIAGAYFIGKRRRAENVGESFVFKSAYYVLTLIFMILLIGASFVGYSNVMEDSGIQWVLLFTFIVYAALEISQNKGFKGFWKTLVRYAAVFGVCIGFFAVVKNTNAFNMYRVLPSAASVKEVRVSGEYFYTPSAFRSSYNKQYILDTKSSVSAILSKHESLLEHGEIKTGDELCVVYVLKNGQEVMRNYSVTNEESDAVKSFCAAVRELPDFDYGDFGVIDKSNISDYTFSLSRRGSPEIFIREEKLEELAEILRNDIKNNYSRSGYNSYYGRLIVTEKNQKHNWDNDYYVLPTFAATIEFLENPDNYINEDVKHDVDTYRCSYTNKNLAVYVTVSTDDTRAAAKELLSYIKPKEKVEGYDPSKDVHITSYYTTLTYTVAPENKEAAVKAMIELYFENH